MNPARQQEASRTRIDPFATEWAMWEGGKQDAEAKSEDARPGQRAPREAGLRLQVDVSS